MSKAGKDRVCGWVKTRVEGIVFDFDGTLADTVDLITDSWVYALEKLGARGRADPGVIKQLIGLPASRIIDALSLGGEALRDVMEYRREYILSNMDRARLYPETRMVLKELRERGYKLAIATSLPRRFMTKLVNYLGVAGLVDALVSGDDVAAGKPDPDIVLEASRRLGVHPSRTITVGDREYDVVSARRAGSIPFLVVRDVVCLEGGGPCVIITSLRDLLEILA